ncbi:hypothetical protein KCP78_06830 [Salmonella enterica subsp. enterica]|nr:hypothetical protein KCP78_06830 [Salmonella enterica subsp. enterica]
MPIELSAKAGNTLSGIAPGKCFQRPAHGRSFILYRMALGRTGRTGRKNSSSLIREMLS